MSTTIALIILALAVIRTWVNFSNRLISGHSRFAAFLLAMVTTWAFYIVAALHVNIF